MTHTGLSWGAGADPTVHGPGADYVGAARAESVGPAQVVTATGSSTAGAGYRTGNTWRVATNRESRTFCVLAAGRAAARGLT